MFKPLTLQSNARRSFQITVGLEEGYGTGIKHTTKEVQDLIGEWLAVRMAVNEKSLAGGVFSGTLIYAWNTPATGIKVTSEDIAVFSGEVSPVYCAHYTDDEVKEVLYNLASFIGIRLKQTRMYVAYKDEIQVYEDDQAAHPTRPVPPISTVE